MSQSSGGRWRSHPVCIHISKITRHTYASHIHLYVTSKENQLVYFQNLISSRIIRIYGPEFKLKQSMSHVTYMMFKKFVSMMAWYDLIRQNM